MDQLTLYDYLTFVLPGGVVLAVSTYASRGWPWPRPSAAILVLLTGAAFVVGYAISGISNLVEPCFLGQRSLRNPDPLWGTLNGPSRMEDVEKQQLRGLLSARYGKELTATAAYRRALVELRAKDKAPMLPTINQHLGFARGMAVASMISAIILIACAIFGDSHLAVQFWVPVSAGAAALFIARFRRFWRWFGENVLRGIAEIVRQEQDGA